MFYRKVSSAQVLHLRGLSELKEWRVDNGAMPMLNAWIRLECPNLDMVPAKPKSLEFAGNYSQGTAGKVNFDFF